jgi:hypothetical protein
LVLHKARPKTARPRGRGDRTAARDRNHARADARALALWKATQPPEEPAKPKVRFRRSTMLRLSQHKKTDPDLGLAAKLSDCAECTFAPVVGKQGENASHPQGSFFSRLPVMVERFFELKDEEQGLDPKVYTFKPTITASYQERGEFMERMYQDIDSRIKNQAKRDTAKPPHSFQPNLSLSARSGYGQGNDAPFLERVEVELERRAKDAALEPKLDPNCVFQPAINKPPKHIRKKLQSQGPFMKRMKEELEIRRLNKELMANAIICPFEPTL